jgi:putative ABC transport system permease protein
VRSLLERQKVDPGFAIDRLLTLKVTPALARYQELPPRIDLYRRITERLRTLPGVESAGAVSILPLSFAVNVSGSFEVEGRPQPQGTSLPEADRRTTTPGYFETLGIRLLDGRTFDERDQDVPDGGSVIIDEVLAKRYWPDQTPIGRRLRTGGDKPWLTVVGVVGHVHHQGPGIETRQQMYFPYTQLVSNSMYLVIRTSRDPLALAANVRAAIREIDPGLPVYDVQTMEERWRESLAKPRLASAILGLFAAVALLLAAVGIYGVTMVSVAQRTPEIGIRLALGAPPRRVLRMVLLQALRLTLAGAAIGLLAAWATTRVFARLLYGVSALDPTAYALVALTLATAALIASLVPAIRATRVDPNASLRVL